MNKLFYSALMLGATVVLFAFSPMKTTSFNYVELNANVPVFGAFEAGSFQEAEHMKTTDDRGVWYKRYRVWTEFVENSSISEIEIIITRN